MLEITRPQVMAALQAVGVAAGDGLLVHSALQYLGRPAEGLATYWEALWSLLGSQGTLAVPAFNFAFARGQAYDPQTTPSQGMGAFSEFVRQRPEALRTPHPMQSLAAAGRYAADLAGRDTLSAFDPGSAFERMLDLDFKLLLLGADIDAISMIHYSEQRLAVPYRYWKEFTGYVARRETHDPPENYSTRRWQKRTYRMYVRDMEMDVHLTLHPVREVLRQRQQYFEAPLNYGVFALLRMRDFIQVLNEFLEADAWSLALNRAAAFQVLAARQGRLNTQAGGGEVV